LTHQEQIHANKFGLSNQLIKRGIRLHYGTEITP